MKMMKVLLVIVLVLGAVSAGKKKNKKKQTAAILEQLNALEERLSASEQKLSETEAQLEDGEGQLAGALETIENMKVEQNEVTESNAAILEQFNALEERLSDSEEKLSETEAQLEDGKGQLAGALETIENMKVEQNEVTESNAWQSLHGAAAAACRGSTASGGTGPWANAVYAKENTRSCTDICGATSFSACDADVSLSGFPDKAADYTTVLGFFYNYGCGGPGNQNVQYDEVKSESGAILTGSGVRGAYYRFCCCRKP